MPSLSRFASDTEVAQSLLSKLTPDERGYFIACTDLFHDTQYNVNGRPSASTQLQNTVVLNLTQTLKATDFPGVTDVWDVNIFSLPFITSQILQSTTDTGFTIEPALVAAFPTVGGVTSVGGPTGANLDLFSVGAANVKTLNANTAIFPGWTASSDVPIARGYYQLLSAGMEIINATPELYRGGNVIRYRIPTQGRSVPLSIYDITSPTYSAWPILPRENFRCYPLPPGSAAFASQYPDSIIDEAVEGSYQMHTLQDSVSDFYVTGNERVCFTSPTPAIPGTANSLISASIFQSGIDYDPPLVRGDFDIVGSYFTGLPLQSILTIRYRVVLSQVPSSSDAYLVSLAKMSPPMNDELDMLISKVQNEFLPGIRAGMNPGGEWWKDVVKSLGKVAKSAGKSALKTALSVGMQQAESIAKSHLDPTTQDAMKTLLTNVSKNKPRQRRNPRAAPKQPMGSQGLKNQGKAKK